MQDQDKQIALLIDVRVSKPRNDDEQKKQPVEVKEKHPVTIGHRESVTRTHTHLDEVARVDSETVPSLLATISQDI